MHKALNSRYVVYSIGIQTFFVQAFKIVVDSWKFITLLLKTWWDDRPFFYDFRFKWTATAEIRIHETKAWLSQLVNFKNAISHFRRTICNKILIKTWKNATETYWMLQNAIGPSCMNQVSVFELHKRFKEGQGVCQGMMRGVGWLRKSIHQSWLVKRLGLGLLCWGFKGVQEEIPREEASTL